MDIVGWTFFIVGIVFHTLWVAGAFKKKNDGKKDTRRKVGMDRA